MQTNIFNNYEKVHGLTFQNKEVLDIILKDDIYYADINKIRENNSYEEDIEQSGGLIPIWCFSPIGLSGLSYKDTFIPDDFYDGNLFERFRQEMSLFETDLNKFEMLELVIPKDRLHRGLTHNSYFGAQVFNSISLNDLVAHYKLYYFKELGDSYDVYPYVRCLTCYQNQCLFPKDLQCFKRRKFK